MRVLLLIEFVDRPRTLELGGNLQCDWEIQTETNALILLLG
jgi:hypothetical protein